MQKIIPCLWFDTQAEEAMNRLTATFKNSAITTLQRHPEVPFDVPDVPSQQDRTGKILTGIFELDGYQFMCLDGGPMFKFTPAISFFVNCETEAELDKVWGVLSDGATTLMPLQAYPFSEKFGWLSDKYGVSWQVNLGARPQKITPYFTFVGGQFGKAEEAINFYTSLFENSGVDNILRYETDDDGGKVGAIKQALFRLNNQEFRAIESNFDHQFSFNEAISFYVECDTQEEVDHFWNKMSAHPEAEACGWLKDKYGVSWQIVPKILGELLNHPDPEKARNVMEVMLQMKKMDIEALKAAAA